MRLPPAEKIKGITLPAIDGTRFEIESIKGSPFMLSFLRFASCPNINNTYAYEISFGRFLSLGDCCRKTVLNRVGKLLVNQKTMNPGFQPESGTQLVITDKTNVAAVSREFQIYRIG